MRPMLPIIHSCVTRHSCVTILFERSELKSDDTTVSHYYYDV